MRKNRRFLRNLLPVLLALAVSAGGAWGKEVFAPDLGSADEGKEGVVSSGGTKVTTPRGGGWKAGKPNPAGPKGNSYLDVPAARGKLSRTEGTIEFWIQNAETAEDQESNARDAKTNLQTLFALVGQDNVSQVQVYVVWKSHAPAVYGEQSYLHVSGTRHYRRDVWGRKIPLGREVKPGEWVHLAFTWSPSGNRVFADGKEIFRGSNSAALEKYYPAGNFGVRLGLDSDMERHLPGGNYPASSTVIAGFKAHDQAVNPQASQAAGLIRSVADDAFKVAGLSGKLVAGDKVSVELLAVPGGKAAFDMGNVKGVPLEEVPPRDAAPGIPAVDNGTYRGSYTVKPGDDFTDGRIVGRFVSPDNVTAEPVASESKWTIDTKPRVTFNVDRKDLPADSAAKARVKLVAKDANGNPVKGRHLKLTLATTDEYTGTVGAGEFGKDVGASVETRWKGETDSWGEVEFDYKAGFAAKTVILTAKDLDSGGVSVDYITAYKEASIDIALTVPVSRAAGRRGLQYIVKVEASRTELTADGRSRSVIRATVLDPNGTTVANDPVAFALSSENGTLRTIRGTTDASGVATAEYVAGKKIGIVVVTATATLRNASGSVSITLLSDAPAKIHLKAKPDTLPADGLSRADLSVKVTDINDNPNRDTKVEFRIGKGGGKLDYADRTTDRFGDAGNRYTAGTTPGVASIVATVRSKVPTEAELARAKNVLFAPYSAEGDEIRVERWLKKKGDKVLAGEPIVEYTAGRSRETRVLAAPYDLTLGLIFVEYWDTAEVGQTLAVVEPVVAR